jgi:DNA-binding NtrC family response regulator
LYSKEDFNPDLTDRDLLYKVLFDMRKDINDLKRTVVEMSRHEDPKHLEESSPQLIRKFYRDISNGVRDLDGNIIVDEDYEQLGEDNDNAAEVEESLSIQDKEIDLIKKALAKHHGKRKIAAKDLGISERTLYRKIKEYDIN